MSMAVVNRVYLPDGTKIYVSDDADGDKRLAALLDEYGDLKIEACNKRFGMSLDDLDKFWTGTIIQFLSA